MDRKLTNTVLKCRVDKIKREYVVTLCPREPDGKSGFPSKTKITQNFLGTRPHGL